MLVLWAVASLLKSRGVIRFRGPDTLKFLQLDDTGTAPGSNPHDPFDASALDELLNTLNKHACCSAPRFSKKWNGDNEYIEEARSAYRLRSKVEIDDVTQDFSCWQRYGTGVPKKSSNEEEPEAASLGCGVMRAHRS
ncbi:hypothetical protein PIB30_058147 [Stylosanthes scabra]|uniref:Uncharacterized protein n=1 Tax=Stylosanthes scabra TaxID=79078 RepID=A0ABU6YIQ5_9FABA|nr:hypothetical protein [Stylosanthes scabra]